MQLRFPTGLTSKEYVTQQAWRDASLERCPLHPRGGCSFTRHGTYGRVSPPGTRIPRWYCPESHRTFSLLADCFAARLSGTLHELETVVDQVEKSRTLEQAVEVLRPDIELPGVLRWTRLRVKAVHSTLGTLKGLMPDRFAGREPTLATFRQQLAVDAVLVALRNMAAGYLPLLPPPLGFCPPPGQAGEQPSTHQHQMGPDPPQRLT